MAGVHWKDITGYEGLYKINNYGEVVNKCGKVIKHRVRGKGYLFVGLCKNGKINKFSVHRLVAIHFIENKYNLPQVNHIDGNKKNNFVGNLEWINNTKNQIHARDNGLTKTKLNNEDVLIIRNLYRNKYYSQQQLADMFKVNQSEISKIVNGKSWVA